jgi:hypothetical protein
MLVTFRRLATIGQEKNKQIIKFSKKNRLLLFAQLRESLAVYMEKSNTLKTKFAFQEGERETQKKKSIARQNTHFNGVDFAVFLFRCVHVAIYRVGFTCLNYFLM